MKTKLLLMSMLLSSIWCLSQRTDDNTYIYIKSPENSVFMYLNDSLLVKEVRYGEHIYLAPGNYSGPIWAQYCIIDTVQFTVPSDSILRYRFELKFTENYKNYKQKMAFYLSKKTAYITVPSIISFTTISSLITSRTLYTKSLSKIKQYEADYFVAIYPKDIVRTKYLYETEGVRLENYRKAYIASSIMSVTSIAASTFFYFKFKKLVKPIKHEEANPFLDKLGVNMSHNQIFLTYKL